MTLFEIHPALEPYWHAACVKMTKAVVPYFGVIITLKVSVVPCYKYLH